ncbi:hypothetical protein [Actinokineospora sp. UTMC 2448]|uniref:hypothetical protein n=1 Tax=Actinokineospora sp. UTMC 2448 TaxID=2268449 RepID=UPI00216427B5|nr:hypothetical protein [Actinokineospora sp. UTMC 2448]UVS81427.1 hypothetical protein Actkin_05185 [Actinokineospora sp. UTMC 2448]
MENHTTNRKGNPPSHDHHTHTPSPLPHTQEPWREFQQRLYHLADLADDLPDFVSGRIQAWLYWEILRETLIIARTATEYAWHAELAKLTQADTPLFAPFRAGRVRDEH